MGENPINPTNQGWLPSGRPLSLLASQDSYQQENLTVERPLKLLGKMAGSSGGVVGCWVHFAAVTPLQPAPDAQPLLGLAVP